MIGAYRATENFAYPGWRLTVPGGPAGGHYKGFTHSEASGTDIPPQDQYEQDREDGMSSHDPVHASPRNPRGVYRSSGEVPPRPNASGSAMTYRGFQTQRHAGTSVAPGSFPGLLDETNEDEFLQRYGEHAAMLEGLGLEMDGLGAIMPIMRMPLANGGGPVYPGWGRPIVNPVLSATAAPSTGATSVVNQPPPTPAPLPPSPSVPVYVAPPVSPAPAPTVATNQVVPLNDGSGNYVNVSTGAVVTPAQVSQNPYSMQLVAASAVLPQLIPANDGSGNYINPQTGAVIPAAAVGATAANTLVLPPAVASVTSGALSWLEQSTLWSGAPNWMILAGAALAAAMLMGGKRR